MALVQTDRDNVVRFSATLATVPIRPIRRLVANVSACLLSFVRRRLGRLAEWSAQRRPRNGLTMAERARQRRALAQLSDRELRDIGITRYDIEFLLRQSSRRWPRAM